MVHWKPNDDLEFKLILPPTVYPPKEDSNLLAEKIIEFGHGDNRNFLEIGCGSGALTILAASRGWKVSACDINPYAVAATRGNLSSNGLEGQILEGGIGPEKFPFKDKFELIIWNLPYVLDQGNGDLLGPLEEASFVDSDKLGLDQRMLKMIAENEMLAENGRILLLSRKEISGFGFAHRIGGKLTFDDGETIVVTCLWNPWENSHSHLVSETSSTNSDLLGMEGVGTRIRAIKQTEGRGRRKRKWFSIEGSYAASWIVSDNSEFEPGFLQISGAIAVLKSLNIDVLKLKWPNDIMIDDRKVCGILAESRTMGDNTKVVLGIGLNLFSNNHKFDFKIGFLDELITPNVDKIDINLNAEISSIFEVGNNLPPIDKESLLLLANNLISDHGRPIYRGKLYNNFELDDSFRLVLDGNILIDEIDDISWENNSISLR